jgi:alpha-amylase/alpha-mannosidase (GH57 family)
MNLYQKLQTARIALQNTKLKKSGHNRFAGFKYFELGDLLPHINNIFDDLGLISAFNIDSTGLASLMIVNIEKPDETLFFTSPTADAQVKGTTPVQALGAVHTYLKRYLYLNALEIVENDMLDASVGTNRLVTEDETKRKETLAKITELMGDTEPDWLESVKTQAKDKYGLTDWKDLPLAALLKVLAKLGG